MLRFLFKSAVFCCILSSGISFADECPSFSSEYKTEIEWSLLAGSAATNAVTIYEGSNATPGARYGSVRWTDNDGNLWLFGGAGRGESGNSWGYLSDLWKYDTSSGRWKFVSGNKTLQAAQGAMPGNRWGATGWKDNAENLYLFGGLNSQNGALSDLWQFDITAGTWELISGSLSSNQIGIFSGEVSLRPGARYGAASWVDKAGMLWMFGGTGYATTTNRGNLNDLWKFNPQTKAWSVVAGGTWSQNINGIYSGLDPYPGSRSEAASWTDSEGKFWLFGGNGFGENGGLGKLQDLWKYDPVSDYWEFVSGGKLINRRGVYTGASLPGGRSQATFALDKDDDLLLFGGSGYDRNGVSGALGDFWKFNITTNEWTFVSGSDTVNVTTDWTNPSNLPLARELANAWTDSKGFVWFFGGASRDGNYNDLLRVNLNADTIEMSALEDFVTTKKVTTFSDPDGSGILTVLSPPSYGTMTIEAQTTDTLVYTPRPNFHGFDECVVQLSSSDSQCTQNTTATVYIYVKPVEDCPELLVSDYLAPESLEWDRITGGATSNSPGIYEGAEKTPGARYGATKWKDSRGNLWLFGGSGRASVANQWGYLADLWKFDVTLNKWEFVAGSKNVNTLGGTLPSSRWGAYGWVDETDNLYLFGGLNHQNGALSDVWKFSPISGSWSLINGTQFTNASSNYFPATARPGGRWGGVQWNDNEGNFWLYGGAGYANGLSGNLADLWKFNPKTLKWTYILGTGQNLAIRPIYSGENARPGSRQYGASWVDHSGDLWLYGGLGLGEVSGTGRLSDVWKFSISEQKWEFIGGSKTVNFNGIYEGSEQYPAARIQASYTTDFNGNLWLYGGTGYARDAELGALSDLWMYDIVRNEWYLVMGSNAVNDPGSITEAPLYPGGREFGSMWESAEGELWMFGGANRNGDHNDLWKLNVKNPSFEINTFTNTPSSLTVNNLIDYDGIGKFEIVVPPVNGIASVDLQTSNIINYVPGGDFEGRDSFIVALTGGSSACDVTTAAIQVLVVPIPPMIVAEDLSVSLNRGQNTIINLPVTSELIDGYFVTQIISQPAHGSIAFSNFDRLVYIPHAQYVGEDEFSYQVVNGSYSSRVAVVKLTITETNSSKVADWNLY